MNKQEKEYALEVWYDTRFDDARFEKARKISIEALEGVAIPSAEPKTGHWIFGSHDTYYGLDDFICSECGERVSKEGEWLYEFCPRCGSPMEHEDDD